MCGFFFSFVLNPPRANLPSSDASSSLLSQHPGDGWMDPEAAGLLLRGLRKAPKLLIPPSHVFFFVPFRDGHSRRVPGARRRRRVSRRQESDKKASKFPHPVLKHFSRLGSSSQALPSGPLLPRPSLHFLLSFCLRSWRRGCGSAGAGARGISSTLPSLPYCSA